MKVYDIDQLKRLASNINLYDLTKLTFKTVFKEIIYNEYKVQKGEGMRIDLVCQSIYGNIENIDIILNVNNISNPLNIKEGTIIIYPSASNISSFRVTDNRTANVQATLSSNNKSTAKDSNREKYVEQNYSLPPTVLDRPTEQVVISGDTIKVGTGLFNK